MTPGKAKKLRHEAMGRCACPLCIWALVPALTYEAHEARMQAVEALNAVHDEEDEHDYGCSCDDCVEDLAGWYGDQIDGAEGYFE